MSRIGREGPFVCIESCDGGGGTTQARLLVERLQREGHEAVGTHQPTEGPVGRMIRDILEHRLPPLATPAAFQLLYVADREHELALNVIPRLRAGVTVVTDRHEISTAIYLAASEPKYRCSACGWTSDLEPLIEGFISDSIDPHRLQPRHIYHGDMVDRQHDLLRLGFRWNAHVRHADLTVVLDVPLDEAVRRRARRTARPDLLDADPIQRRVCAMYADVHHTIAKGEMAGFRDYPFDGPRVVTVSGIGAEEDIHARIWQAVQESLPSWEL